MATVFFKKDSLSERDTPYQTRMFPTVEEARTWVDERKSKSRWFSCRHISALNVEAMPRYLVISHENGRYMSVLNVMEECGLHNETVIKLVSPTWGWATAGRRVSAYSTNGSLFSTSACAPTYIDVFAKGLETLSYVLLGGCERPVEGVDMELAKVLLAKRPRFEGGRFPQEAELEELKYGKHKLVTKKMKERITELEATQTAFNSARHEAAELFQVNEVQAWYDEVLRLCLPQGYA